MKMLRVFAAACALLMAASGIAAGDPTSGEAAEPIRLHPENPHYFLWRGKPTVLKSESFGHGGGDRMVVSPAYGEDIALRVNRTNKPKEWP